MFRDIYYSLRSFYHNIKNLVIWFPVIWEQREYDHIYLFKLVYKKLELMEKHMNSKYCMRSIHQDRYIKQVKLCKNLCKRILDNNYLENALTRHHELYGRESKMRFVDCPDKPGFRQVVWDDTPQEHASFRRAGKHEVMMEKQDYDLLFKLLRKHVRKWWD